MRADNSIVRSTLISIVHNHPDPVFSRMHKGGDVIPLSGRQSVPASGRPSIYLYRSKACSLHIENNVIPSNFRKIENSLKLRLSNESPLLA